MKKSLALASILFLNSLLITQQTNCLPWNKKITFPQTNATPWYIAGGIGLLAFVWYLWSGSNQPVRRTANTHGSHSSPTSNPYGQQQRYIDQNEVDQILDAAQTAQATQNYQTQPWLQDIFARDTNPRWLENWFARN